LSVGSTKVKKGKYGKQKKLPSSSLKGADACFLNKFHWEVMNLLSEERHVC
jgi:hypothetical protein